MKQKGEERKVSMPEEVLARILVQIKTDVSRPVGIILFGFDCDFKNWVVEKFMQGLESFACFHTNALDTVALSQLLKEQSKIFTIVNSHDSANADLLESMIETMRDSGVQSVVGIYVQADRSAVVGSRPLQAKMRMMDRIRRIERSKPAEHSFDEFFILMSEEEG